MMLKNVEIDSSKFAILMVFSVSIPDSEQYDTAFSPSSRTSAFMLHKQLSEHMRRVTSTQLQLCFDPKLHK